MQLLFLKKGLAYSTESIEIITFYFEQLPG